MVLAFPVLISTLFITVAYKAVQPHCFSDEFWGTSKYIAKKPTPNQEASYLERKVRGLSKLYGQ